MTVLKNDIGYTSRERIVLNEEIVTNNLIKVSTDHTGYANYERVAKLDIAEILKLHTEIAKIAKSKGVKVSYKNKTKSKLLEIKKNGTYEAAYELYTQRFDQLVQLWRVKLEEGLYMGTRDDVILENHITPLQHAITAMFYRSEVMSIVAELKYRLKELHRELLDENPNSYFVKIYL
ncbi:hypothetical protein NSQ62_08135 [Solibacillus sp. FSL H8-0523]|uniref:hypothetical protein n=1 Tax=Solibacillus sp. FSL H8-0523 TaxID=2954511 RepID=UPI0031011AF7